MSKAIRIIAVALAVLAMVGLVISSFPATFFTSKNPAPTPPSEKITADSPADFRFEIASTTAARELGLSGRTEVPEGYGMLFVFPEPGRYGFWMKDMKVAIDMIWIDEGGTIVGIEHAASPDSFPQVFYPPSDILYVLETRVGESEMQGWTIGSRIPLPVL